VAGGNWAAVAGESSAAVAGGNWAAVAGGSSAAVAGGNSAATRRFLGGPACSRGIWLGSGLHSSTHPRRDFPLLAVLPADAAVGWRVRHEDRCE